MHSFFERARREKEEKEGEMKKEAIFTELGHAFEDNIQAQFGMKIEERVQHLLHAI
jgi:hypothetical protein